MNDLRPVLVAVSLGTLLNGCAFTQEAESAYSPDSVALMPPASVEELTGYFEAPAEGIPWYLLKWEDDPALSGELLIVVDKKKQMLYAYRGETRICHSPVSTGRSSGSTPVGYYRVTDKKKEHRSFYGSFVSVSGKRRDADLRKQSAGEGERFEPSQMPYFMRVCGNVGIHQGYLPGKPASHGCIRLPMDIAKNLFEITPKGTRVAIVDGKWNIAELQALDDALFTTVPKAKPKDKEREPRPILPCDSSPAASDTL